jgi:hypothetical protein
VSDKSLIISCIAYDKKEDYYYPNHYGGFSARRFSRVKLPELQDRGALCRKALYL